MNETLAETVLLREYERMCAEVRAVESNNEKAIAFGLSIITAAFAVGIAQHVHPIFFLIPIAIVGVFFYASLMYTYIFSMGGYKAYLEDRLNERIGSKLLLWETLVQIRQRRNVIRPALVAIYVVIGFILGTVSELDIKVTFGLNAALYEACFIVGLLVVLLVALVRMWSMHSLFYREATKQFEATDGGIPL